jgi:polyphosphate kinase 2 (PPK2 family)
LRKTSRGETPWHIVESSDERYRNLTVAEILHAELSKRLEAQPSESTAAEKPAPEQHASDTLTVLDKVDLTAKLPKDDYQKSLKKLQTNLNLFSREARRKGVSTVLLFEGWDERAAS